MRYSVGIDLGGTNIAVGLLQEDGTLLKTVSQATNSQADPKEILDDIGNTVDQLLEEAKVDLSQITFMGIGVPGTANHDTGFIEDVNNLNLENTDVISYFQKRYHKKILFENDANAAAWGEYIAGVGKESRPESMLMVTLGTGIGGGIILHGKIFHGFNDGAAEFGHMVIRQGGAPCTCGRKGCFEAYASATALIDLCRSKIPFFENSLLWKLCDGKIEKINGKMIFDALRKGDTLADQVVLEYEEYLATGIINLINIFQPEILCIGGGISQSGDILLPLLQALVQKEVYTQKSKKQTQIVIAKLHNDAGIIGAGMLNEQNMQ